MWYWFCQSPLLGIMWTEGKKFSLCNSLCCWWHTLLFLQKVSKRNTYFLYPPQGGEETSGKQSKQRVFLLAPCCMRTWSWLQVSLSFLWVLFGCGCAWDSPRYMGRQQHENWVQGYEWKAGHRGLGALKKLNSGISFIVKDQLRRAWVGTHLDRREE